MHENSQITNIQFVFEVELKFYCSLPYKFKSNGLITNNRAEIFCDREIDIIIDNKLIKKQLKQRNEIFATVSVDFWHSK